MLWCVTALSLSSCSKKSASHRSLWSDADVFFAESTMQTCKSAYSRGAAPSDTDPLTTSQAYSLDERALQALLDVPLPVDAVQVSGYQDYMMSQELSLVRHTATSLQDLYDFYIGMF